MLEQQIYSIESANINQETLVAMKNAGKAMKEIHGKMTMEDVDTTMWAILIGSPRYLHNQRMLMELLQGATPRTTRTHSRNRQRHHFYAHHRAYRRRRIGSRFGGTGARKPGREDVEDGDCAGGRQLK